MRGAAIVGAVALVWALSVLLLKGIVKGLRRDVTQEGWLVPGIAVGLTSLLLHSFVDFNLQIYSNGMLFAFLCAALLRHASTADPRRAA